MGDASMMLPAVRLRSGDLIRYGSRWAEIDTVTVADSAVEVSLLDIDVRYTAHPERLTGPLALRFAVDDLVESRPDVGERIDEFRDGGCDRTSDVGVELTAICRFWVGLHGVDYFKRIAAGV